MFLNFLDKYPSEFHVRLKMFIERPELRHTLTYTSSQHTVYKVRDCDYNCDLHILAWTPDESEKLLTPRD